MSFGEVTKIIHFLIYLTNILSDLDDHLMIAVFNSHALWSHSQTSLKLLLWGKWRIFLMFCKFLLKCIAAIIFVIVVSIFTLKWLTFVFCICYSCFSLKQENSSVLITSHSGLEMQNRYNNYELNNFVLE